jgi:ectoine hydroxylase-related dioxygenase (phytanoyl-CoA dioxygenase family)
VVFCLGGILPFYGSGHSSFSWFIRESLAVAQVFSALHFGDISSISTDSLVSSLDGVVLWGQDTKTESGWFHVDQNPLVKPDFACIQGLVNLLPVTPSTGGNVLVSKSHLAFPGHYTTSPYFEKFYKQRLDEVHGDDWMEGGSSVVIPWAPRRTLCRCPHNFSPPTAVLPLSLANFLSFYFIFSFSLSLLVDPRDDVILKPLDCICLQLRPGDVLLWDSRTAHCSYPGDGSDKNPAALIRAASLVSMIPRNQVSEGALVSRWRVFLNVMSPTSFPCAFRLTALPSPL